jgi:hypothetical protein
MSFADLDVCGQGSRTVPERPIPDDAEENNANQAENRQDDELA